MGPYLGLGSGLAITILFCLGAGYWLDGKFGTRPILFLAGGAFGIGVALYQFVRSVGKL
jgi:hypothetical protein